MRRRAGYAAVVAPNARRGGRGSGEERAAAALSGGGPSVLGVEGSMRARDVSRPTERDYADAERLVQVSHRQGSPPRPGQSGSGGKSPETS